MSGQIRENMRLNHVYQMDCLEGLKSIPSESIHLCVTDPAYKTISGGRKRKEGQPSGILLSNDGKIFQHNNIKIKDWMTEVYRVLKPQSHFYVMTNTLNLQEMLNIATEIGFKLHNLLVWKKNNCTPSQYYMKNAEYILFLRKGKAKYIHNLGSKTVIEIDNVRNKLHPTEKPVELMELFIQNSSNEGDIILDPFMGSFTTAIATLNVGGNRKFIGFEIDPTYIEIGNQRLLPSQY
ncbi:site-specific DNA-methyltransferase [Bacillus sp. M6-12]|uniref:DNA-methyltransferase n=1 Tax=Bacillus sp. M6-12 TaxID=2054166 RepID=UPI000C76A83A|nr:site-specific DNA-methyltransferase [Bacillus sp. M6-12]PLS19699.1 site-specific DNA-methyltransferase [Bacillus sp. M6-12]